MLLVVLDRNCLVRLIENRVLDEYKMFKVNFIYKEYLVLVPHNLRCFITRLRISAHFLCIYTGQFGVNRLPRHERLR